MACHPAAYGHHRVAAAEPSLPNPNDGYPLAAHPRADRSYSRARVAPDLHARSASQPEGWRALSRLSPPHGTPSNPSNCKMIWRYIEVFRYRSGAKIVSAPVIPPQIS